MPWTIDQLAAHDQAIASAFANGVQRVQYADGASVTYMSIDDALKLRAAMQLDVANANLASGSGTGRIRAFRGSLTSGY